MTFGHLLFLGVTSLSINVFLIVLISILFYGNSLCQKDDSVKTYQLQNVFVTATKFSTNIKNLPNKAEIITTEQIKNSNGNRLPEILNVSPTVFIKSYGATPSLKTLSLNGLGAEHTLILIDGVKLNSIQNGQIDLSLIPLENIERIEIVNNGLSSIYGSEAVGGIVNIITSIPTQHDNNLNARASFGYGSFNTSRYQLHLDAKLKNLSSAISFSKEKSDGNFDYYFHNGQISQLKKRENAAYSINDIGINSQFIINKKSRFKFLSSYSYQDKEVPGIETGTPPSLSNQRDKNWNNILTYENILNSKLTLKTNFNYQNNLMNYSVKPLINSFYKINVLSFSPEFQFKLSNLELSTGYNFLFGNLKSNQIEGNPKRNQHGLFISLGNNFIDGVKIYSSFRGDFFSDLKKSAITSRIGLNIKPFEEFDLNLKANLGNNFRAPTFNDLYWKDAGNPNLKPERSLNFETGFVSSFDFLIPIQVEFFYNYINFRDKIMWMPQRNFIWRPINVASSLSNNFLFNISVKHKIQEGTTVKVNCGLNFINSKKTNESFEGDPSKHKYLPYIPIQSFKLSTFIEFKQFNLNLFFTHNGKRFSDFENTKPMNPSNILDGNVSYQFSILSFNSLIKFEVYNITNTNYQIISGYPMPLRNYFITITIIN